MNTQAKLDEEIVAFNSNKKPTKKHDLLRNIASSAVVSTRLLGICAQNMLFMGNENHSPVLLVHEKHITVKLNGHVAELSISDIRKIIKMPLATDREYFILSMLTR
ncbi:MAG TPA: hypothetical protein VF817_02425 [Patescibacteria group bacterium]